MSGIFTRTALRDILNDENLTAEEKAGQIFSLHGQAIDVGFVSKKAAETLKSEAVAEALQNAASVASMLLTTEAGITQIKEPEPAMPQGGGGMGMM